MTDQSHREPVGPFAEQALEFRAVLEVLRGYLTGPIAAPLVERLQPSTNLNAIRRDLECAGEAREYQRTAGRPSLESLADPRPVLEQLGVQGVVLAPREIRLLLDVARAARDLRGLFRETPQHRLDELAGSLADFRALLAELDGKILPDGSVDSSASRELARLRRTIEDLKRRVQNTLEKLLRRLSREEVVQDAVVTLRNERFVIPIRSEAKRRVEGVIHGASSSGATVFVEPLETLPLNNELVELQDREFAEVQRILAEFSARLRARSGDLLAAAEILGELDLAFAKAAFAAAYDCCLPEFAAERTLRLKAARHPLLEKTLRARGEHPVPMTVELAGPQTLMVISGPNTGGKTVALKTLGVAVLMAQAGLPVAAAEARLPVFRRVLADIGDQQSIEASLSTFAAHILNIQSMVEAAGSGDLVLLDEIGASTEPGEGAALAVAILEHFRKRGATTVVTTHHSRLKAYAAERPEAVNAAMEFDEATLGPTFRLLVGLPGKSSGLDTAERLGLDPSVVHEARRLLSPSDAETTALLDSLHELKGKLDRQFENLRDEQRKFQSQRSRWEEEFRRAREKKLRELDARLEETMRQAEARWQRELEGVRKQAQTAGERLSRRLERQPSELRRETKEEWNAQVLETLGAPAEETTDAPPAVGDRVRVSNLSSPATVSAVLDGGRIEVQAGSLRMRVPRDEVRVVARGSSGQPVEPAGPRAQLSRPAAEAPAEINVIGATAEEACERVDKFLDEAYVAGRFRLRVIHGHGKGILRKRLHEMFVAHPHVEKFSDAPPHEGGSGATIVELKM